MWKGLFVLEERWLLLWGERASILWQSLPGDWPVKCFFSSLKPAFHLLERKAITYQKRSQFMCQSRARDISSFSQKSAIQLCSEDHFIKCINIWCDKVWDNFVQIIQNLQHTLQNFVQKKTAFLVHTCFPNLLNLKIHLHNPAQGRQSDSLRKRSGLLYIRMKFWMERRSSPERKVAWGTIE